MADRRNAARRHAPIQETAPEWEGEYAELVAELAAGPCVRPGLFRSFFHGGFECSTHRRPHDRQRVDVIAATGHDGQAAADYRLLGEHGIRTVRDGVRWHLVARDIGRFDWSSLDPMLAAARKTGTQVIWDLLHYGWPDWLDIWSEAFAARFAEFGVAAAERIRAATDGACFYAPVNEISFFAWGGGDVACLNPFERGRGEELKRRLARAAAAAMAAIRAVDAGARFVHPDPLIRVAAAPRAGARFRAEAEGYTRAQFDGWDMIAGRRFPELGGRDDYLDVVGANYYPPNQWLHMGARLVPGDPLHKPFRYLLMDAFARYRRPIFIAETGTEAAERVPWFRYVCDEVRAAMRAGVPIEGICLYPVLNHPGWDNGRNCPNGMIEFAGRGAPRTVYAPLAAELGRQQALFAAEFGIGG